MSRDILDAEFLVRIEGILDALEARGKTQRNFLPYVQSFKHVWKWLQGKSSLKQAVDVSDGLERPS